MSEAPDMAFHRPALAHLAEMTSAVLEAAFARVQASEGRGFHDAVEAFSDLGRGLRLTIGLDLRLAAFARASARPVRVRAQAVQNEAAENEALEPIDAFDRPERPDPPEREREVEHDGFAMEPLGRVLALESLITRTPALDPDHKVSAEIIQLKAFLAGPEPVPPDPTPPDLPAPLSANPSPGPTSGATLGRLPNRAERRRQRHASG